MSEWKYLYNWRDRSKSDDNDESTEVKIIEL